MLSKNFKIECKMVSMEKLTVWILGELEQRDWKPADLARRAGMSTGALSNIMSGNRRPGPDACVAIARALSVPPEKVFRIAGLLPLLPGPEDDKSIGEIVELIKRLPPSQRKEVLDYALWRFQKGPDADNPLSSQSNLETKPLG